MADAHELFNLSVPEIVDKLFEGATIKLPMNVFADIETCKAFINNLRTAKSRMTKKFRTLGMEFDQDQAVLSIVTEGPGSMLYEGNLLIIKLVPPKQPKYAVIVEMPESSEG